MLFYVYRYDGMDKLCLIRRVVFIRCKNIKYKGNKQTFLWKSEGKDRMCI